MPVAKWAVREVARDDDQLAVARAVFVGGEFHRCVGSGPRSVAWRGPIVDAGCAPPPKAAGRAPAATSRRAAPDRGAAGKPLAACAVLGASPCTAAFLGGSVELVAGRHRPRPASPLRCRCAPCPRPRRRRRRSPRCRPKHAQAPPPEVRPAILAACAGRWPRASHLDSQESIRSGEAPATTCGVGLSSPRVETAYGEPRFRGSRPHPKPTASEVRCGRAPASQRDRPSLARRPYPSPAGADRQRQSPSLGAGDAPPPLYRTRLPPAVDPALSRCAAASCAAPARSAGYRRTATAYRLVLDARIAGADAC